MTTRTLLAAALLSSATLIAFTGCQQHDPDLSPTTMLAPATRAMAPSPDQHTYASPPEALAALDAAVRTGDPKALRPIFGPPPRELLSGDPIADGNDYKTFIAAAKDHLETEVAPGGNAATLFVGKDRWPSPIPLVRTEGGQWYFDLAAATDKLLARRIGANELRTIDICRAYVAAQRDYASVDRDADGVLQYAQHFISTPGRHDGLFWESTGPNDVSPFNESVAAAADEGYHPKAGVRSPYHGYYLHSLHAQGKDAPGGAYSYVINGRQLAGFAMIAYPARYGSSGIMTFIINHQGRTYQKDLGPDTDRLAQQITDYNPDSTWTLVKE